VQKLKANIDRVGLVQEEFCLWVILALYPGRKMPMIKHHQRYVSVILSA
jgi:hypothetical protein